MQTLSERKSIPIRFLRQARQNERIYRPVRSDDPAIIELAESIAENGVLEPVIISEDYTIISGHRRRQAAMLAGLSEIPCIVKAGVFADSPEFTRLLVDANAQRVKTAKEQIHEKFITSNPDDAYQALLGYRESKTRIDNTMRVQIRGDRKGISKVKKELVDSVIDLLDRLRQHWPLTVRQMAIPHTSTHFHTSTLQKEWKSLLLAKNKVLN